MIPYKLQKIWSDLRHGEKFRLHLYPTFRCNLSCSYCSADWYHGHRPKSKGKELNFIGWKEVLEQQNLGRIKEVVITGGELFLHKNINDIIQYLLDLDMFVILNTNLVFANRLTVPPHKRLMFWVSKHFDTMNEKELKKFNENEKRLRRKGYNLKIKTLGKTHPINDKHNAYDYCYLTPGVAISPTGNLHPNLRSLISKDTF